MAERTADVRRDIELTRERMSSTIAELEHKLNVVEIVREHPWPAIALAVGAGVVLSRSGADIKAAAATTAATRGAGSRIGNALDQVVADLMTSAQGAIQTHVDSLVGEVKTMLGAPRSGSTDGQGGYGVGPMDISERGPTALGDARRAD